MSASALWNIAPNIRRPHDVFHPFKQQTSNPIAVGNFAGSDLIRKGSSICRTNGSTHPGDVLHRCLHCALKPTQPGFVLPVTTTISPIPSGPLMIGPIPYKDKIGSLGSSTVAVMHMMAAITGPAFWYQFVSRRRQQSRPAMGFAETTSEGF